MLTSSHRGGHSTSEMQWARKRKEAETHRLSSPRPRSLDVFTPCVSHIPSPHKPLGCLRQVRPCPSTWGSEKSETVTLRKSPRPVNSQRLSSGAWGGEVCRSLWRSTGEGRRSGGTEMGRKCGQKDQPIRMPGQAWGPRCQQGSWIPLPGSHRRHWSGAVTIMAHLRWSSSNSMGKVTHPHAGPCVGKRYHCCRLQRGPPGFGNNSHPKIRT